MAERLKEKAQTKKAGVASITKLRKQRQRDGFAGELDMDAELARPGTGRKPAMAPGQRIRPGALLGVCCKQLHFLQVYVAEAAALHSSGQLPASLCHDP